MGVGQIGPFVEVGMSSSNGLGKVFDALEILMCLHKDYGDSHLDVGIVACLLHVQCTMLIALLLLDVEWQEPVAFAIDQPVDVGRLPSTRIAYESNLDAFVRTSLALDFRLGECIARGSTTDIAFFHHLFHLEGPFSNHLSKRERLVAKSHPKGLDGCTHLRQTVREKVLPPR